MKLTYAVLFAAMTLVAEEKPAPKYVVHWTSEVRDAHQVYAVACFPATPDCGAVWVLRDNWSPVDSKAKMSEFISDLTRPTYLSGDLAFPSAPPRNPRIVAIYELKPVPAKITEERIETPQPPQVEIRQKVVLP